MHALINNVTYLLPSQPLSFSHSELIGRHMTDSSPRYFPPGPGVLPPMAERTVNFLVFKNDASNLACMLKRLLSAFFSLFFLGAASGTSFAEVTVPDVLKDRIALKKRPVSSISFIFWAVIRNPFRIMNGASANCSFTSSSFTARKCNGMAMARVPSVWISNPQAA